MLIEIGVVLASIIPAIVIGAVVARQLTDWRWAVAIMQALAGAAIGFVAVELLSLGLIVVPVAAVASQTLNVVAKATKLNNRRQRHKARNGDYGEKTQWAVEIVESGDEAFALAFRELPEQERRDLGIIAESKEELRELAIERFDELTEETLPEDFA